MDIRLARLLQITSPSLPVGGYSYSQGLESSVHNGWINDTADAERWLQEQLEGTITQQDLPLVIRLYQALINDDDVSFYYWDSIALAVRETSELRREEQQRGKALMNLLQSLELPASVAPETQCGAFACFCAAESISLQDALAGYTYSWLDSQVTAAIKLVPLGQAEGQGILYRLSAHIPASIENACAVGDTDIGYTSPALAIASGLHETQYSRLFRS